MTEEQIREAISQFRRIEGIEYRNASFDICYSYFQINKGSLSDDMERSCLYLFSYLASWGMLRNSNLMKKSPVALIPLIEYFDRIAQDAIWSIDVDRYNELASIDTILRAYYEIQEFANNLLAFPGDHGLHKSITLVTKIMLGVFGCIPAFDSNFVTSFHDMYAYNTDGPRSSFYRVNGDSLACIYHFYNLHRDTICEYNIPVMNFLGDNTGMIYSKAKIIDMCGFSGSGNEDE